MKKLINLIALVMLVSTNVLTPFSYAQDALPEVNPENEVKTVEESLGEAGETFEVNEETPDLDPEEKGEIEQENQEAETSEKVLPDAQDDIETPATDESDKDFTENQDNKGNTSDSQMDLTEKESLASNNNEIMEQENIETDNPELQKPEEISTMDVVTTNPKNIVIEAISTEENQTISISKYFANDYTVDRGEGGGAIKLTSRTGHTYLTSGTHTITLSLTGTATRWSFYCNYDVTLVPKAGTTVTGVKIVFMPSLADGFGSNKTNPGNCFFDNFNRNGALTSLPEGSFDTSNITRVGRSFFEMFNEGGALESLPEGSFDLSNITTVGNEFFWGFNRNGALTSLPTGSFNIGNIRGSVGNNFFSYFNAGGKITSLPTGSFNIDKITGVGYSFFHSFNENGKITSLPTGSFNTSNIKGVGSSFFASFNEKGKITSLPEGSFDISKITKLDSSFFSHFNYNGALTSLPDGSFDISGIKTVDSIYVRGFFSYFNYNGALTSLPDGSFDTSNMSGEVGENFFNGFNYNGALTSLPDGSFNIHNITKVGNNFFSNFNFDGALESLPEGSFDTSNISGSVRESFFSYFNARGKITSLPEGSFDTSNITKVNYGFFKRFNWEGKITSLPEGSFDTSNITGSLGSDYFEYAFNSISYTLNRKVLDIVSGGTAPTSKMNTFSYNQLGQCGVNPNWLVSANNACRITYYASGAIGGYYRYGHYISNATEVEVGSGITNPRREGYYIEGWYDASGNRIDTIIFPEMNEETLYANWGECENGYIANHSGTECVLKEYSIVHDLKGGYFEDNGKKYEGNQEMTYTYNAEENNYYNLNPKIIKRENSKFLGWFTSKGDEFDFGKIPGDDDIAYAKYECNLGYVENEEKTACEKIGVEFDANGGKFSNGKSIYLVESTLKEEIKDEVKYSHTPNIDNEGNQSGDYALNLSTNEVITLTGAESIHVKIIYGGESAYYDYVCMWTGSHPEYTAYYDCYTSVTNRLGGGNHTSDSNIKEYDITGDTVTFAFRSDGIGVGDGYGYYAAISGKVISEGISYEDLDLISIEEPTRNGYKFIGWYYNDEGTEKIFKTDDIKLDRIYNVYAKREKLGSSGGGGGGGSSKDTDKDTHGSAEDSQKNSEENAGKKIPPVSPLTEGGLEQPQGQNDASLIKGGADPEVTNGKAEGFTPEFQQAYKFAHENGITTKDTIQSAQMNGKLTRIAMAKMLSQYAINVLGQTPDTSKTVKFKDVSNKKDADYDNGVTLAYQLGIMGQNMPGNKFRPNDEVSRAEFATALSRLLYQTTDGEYKSTKEYYIPHMAKLYNEGIISNTDPSMAERRGYVMIMLMRSAK